MPLAHSFTPPCKRVSGLPRSNNLPLPWCTASSQLRSCVLLPKEDQIQYADDHWIPFILTTFANSMIFFDPRLLGQTIDALPSFPHVRKLTATISLPTPAETLRILSKFPAVEILSITDKRTVTYGHPTRRRPSVNPISKNTLALGGLYLYSSLIPPLRASRQLLVNQVTLSCRCKELSPSPISPHCTQRSLLLTRQCSMRSSLFFPPCGAACFDPQSVRGSDVQPCCIRRKKA
ncbi:hypothetical protein C8R43DRAFT_553335 [Mycena crocata]|nr:hypothetical protein C8R43DRAFT_553335 [Mycena crocata]